MAQMTPSYFAAEVLGLTMWDKFSAVFEAVAAGKRRILVRSANGVGKTTALAALCNWKLYTHDECIVLTTSSSEKQLRHNLWGEIRRQAAEAALYDEDAITDTRIKLGEKRFMIGVSPAKPESAQGYHAASILIAIDEATGVRRDIISSLLATATGDDVQIVMIYNPMSTDSFVYEAERSGEWEIITIGAQEHPNITTESNLIPGAVTAQNTEERLKLWSYEVEPHSERSFEFRGKWWRRTLEVSRRILGEWHDDVSEGLIPMHLIKESLKVESVPGVKSLGIDLAGGGEDETVIAYFDGNMQLPMRVVRSSNVYEVAKIVAEEHKRGFTQIAVDETAQVGGLTPILRKEYGIDKNLYSVNFASKARRKHDGQHQIFGNRRMEMYYNILQELKEHKIRLLDDAMLHQELASVRLSDRAETEKYFLELKRYVRQRLARSPDRADATVLARYAQFLSKHAVPLFDFGKKKDVDPEEFYNRYWGE